MTTETAGREQRTELLIGRAGLERLHRARILLFGVGGVGSFACEALVRAGIGHITIVDGDLVALSNLNRQIIADYHTVGRPKAEVMRERALSIAPDCDFKVINRFYLPGSEEAASISMGGYDYVLDAIDDVAAKTDIIIRAKTAAVPVISAMGAGNKLDNTCFRVADISKTRVCPLARAMRRELARRGIGGVKCVYSEEPPLRPQHREEAAEGNGAGACGESRQAGAGRAEVGGLRPSPGSISYVPGTAGLIMAGEVIRDLLQGL